MAEPGLALAAGLRLLRDAEQGTHTLVLESNESVQLNEYAASILVLCDGRRSAEDVATAAAQAAGRQYVLEFLAAARALRWVVPIEPR